MFNEDTKIDVTSITELQLLGFEIITNVGEPFSHVSCGYRHRGCGVHLFPIFEPRGDSHLYFEFTGGRLQIDNYLQVQKLVDAMTPMDLKQYRINCGVFMIDYVKRLGHVQVSPGSEVLYIDGENVDIRVVISDDRALSIRSAKPKQSWCSIDSVKTYADNYYRIINKQKIT